MLPAQRQARIVQQLQEGGFVEISQLSESLGADRSTIRRDLRGLEVRGLVRRARGGALPGPAAGHADIPYKMKRVENRAAKQAIGRFAASLVGDSESVVLDSGSTTFEVARALLHRHDVSVVTNDLNVAICLAEAPRVQLVVTGGILLESVYALVGPQTVAELRGLHVDRVFLGADAIDHEAGITNMTFVEVEVKRAMVEAAREVIVVADSSKFGNRALAPVCGLDGIDVIVTDDGLHPSVRDLYGDSVTCISVDGSSHGHLDGGAAARAWSAQAAPKADGS